MIQTYYQVDKEGFITDTFLVNDKEEKVMEGLIKKWEGEIPFPRYDFFLKKWVNDTSSQAIFLEEQKQTEAKLSFLCREIILSGFTSTFEKKKYHFSYEQENQINFQDTMRLFENDMIAHTFWNGYGEEGKVRLHLNKEAFSQIYLDSIKHKQKALSYLHEIVLPKIQEAKNVSELHAIDWAPKEGEIQLDIQNTLVKKVGNLSVDMIAQNIRSEQMEYIILDVADLALSNSL